MKTYVWLTFAFLGWGYYEASGGADFQPGPATEPAAGLVAAAEAQTAPAAPPATAPRARGSVQRQLETALLTALRDKHTVARPGSLNAPQVVSFVEQPGQVAEVAAPAPAPAAMQEAPPPRPEDLAAEPGAAAAPAPRLAIGPNTAAAPDSSPRPQLRPRELAGAPVAAMPRISTRGPGAATERFRSGRVTASRANMRFGPGTGFPVLRALPNGAEVRILRNSGDGWVKLRSVEDGRIGWMAGHLVAAR